MNNDNHIISVSIFLGDKLMNIIEKNNNIILEGVEDFDVGQTLECGQCFRFEKIGEEYILIAKNKILRIEQKEDKVIFYDTKLKEYHTLWKDYFDLDRDYGQIKKRLVAKDSILRKPIQAKYGIHILNQDFFEMLISFIISQNKQIPHIKQIVELLSIQYGEPVGEMNNKVYYSFPSVEKLGMVSEEDFRKCKAGFRAPYLVDACRMVSKGDVIKDKLVELSSEEALMNLISIKGVGEKIANCVLLYGLSRREAFPVDVWMKRVMENLYFHKETKKEVIQQFAKEQFGEYGGYAQQYLFFYARDGKMKNIS